MDNVQNELIQTIDDFRSNGIDLTQYFNMPLLVFNRRNVFLYIELNGTDINVFNYGFKIIDGNLSYDVACTNSTFFPQCIDLNAYDRQHQHVMDFFPHMLSYLVAANSACMMFADNQELICENNYLMSRDKKILFLKIGENDDAEIDNNITAIASHACTGNSGIRSLENFKSVKTIGQSAFFGSPVGSISGLDNLQSIEPDAFRECNSISSIDLSQSQLSSISFNAFEDCYSISSVVLPPTTFAIDYEAFAQCKMLQSVSILISAGNKVIIHPAAFARCSSLREITINGHSIFSDFLKQANEYQQLEQKALLSKSN